MLQVRHFNFLTDHKPLTSVFHQKGGRCSPQHINHLDISQFTAEIRHISGQDNIVADTLSRVKVITAPITHDVFIAAEDDDEALRTPLLRNVSQQIEKLFILGTSVEPFCHSSAGKPRPVVPSPLRRQVFNSLHSLSLPGNKTTAKLLSQCFVWPAIHKNAALGPKLANPASVPKFLATPSLH